MKPLAPALVTVIAAGLLAALCFRAFLDPVPMVRLRSLRKGMTRDEVRRFLGPPTRTYDSGQWTYQRQLVFGFVNIHWQENGKYDGEFNYERFCSSINSRRLGSHRARGSLQFCHPSLVYRLLRFLLAQSWRLLSVGRAPKSICPFSFGWDSIGTGDFWLWISPPRQIRSECFAPCLVYLCDCQRGRRMADVGDAGGKVLI
jgi:hypothetical protein